MLFCRKKFQIKYFRLPPFTGKPLFPVPPLPVNKQRRESLGGLKAFDEMINGPTEGIDNASGWRPGRMSEVAGVLKNPVAKGIGLFLCATLVIICMYLSVWLGITNVDWRDILHAYTHFSGTNIEIIVRETRVPRALIAAAVGASLAISGALMQGLTRNPLASPGILGINAGAGFFIVIALSFLHISSMSALAWIAFLGAALTSVIVYGLGAFGTERLTPMKLTLAGASMAAFFSSLTQGVLTADRQSLDAVIYWLVGSVQGRSFNLLLHVLPYFVIGWIGALLIAAKMNTLALGDAVATGVGQNPLIVKMAAGLIVILLAGSSVAIAGPIGFIGIIVPHMSKWFVGQDYRWLIPYSALLGAILLLLADISARFVMMSQEVPVGIMTAVIGTPFFITIARKGVWR